MAVSAPVSGGASLSLSTIIVREPAPATKLSMAGYSLLRGQSRDNRLPLPIDGVDGPTFSFIFENRPATSRLTASAFLTTLLLEPLPGGHQLTRRLRQPDGGHQAGPRRPGARQRRRGRVFLLPNADVTSRAR
jgi:hypothetical protein